MKQSTIIVGIATILALACGTGAGTPDVAMSGDDVRSVLVPVGVDTLPETQANFVGKVRSAVIGSDGTVFVSDAFARRIAVFDVTRRGFRAVGRAGDGPGEFEGPAAIAIWGRDTIAVTDPVNQSVSLFGAHGDHFLHRAHVSGLPTSASASGSKLFVAVYSPFARTAVATWRSGADTLLPWLPLPMSVTRNNLAMRAFPLSFVTSRGDTVAVGFASSAEILVARDGQPPSDRFTLPAVRRRPIPDDLDAALAPVVTSPGRLTLIPTLDGLYWRPDGLIVVWHKDWTAPPEGLKAFERAATQATLHAYASVVDRANRRVCADIPIPTDWAENPALLAHGEFFFAIGHAADGPGKPLLLVRRYQLAIGRCHWTALR